MTGPLLDDLLRPLVPQVVGVLTRRSGDFAAAEDAVQEALLDAVAQWPAEGVPGNPRGWLVQVASRRMTERVRNEQARRRREERVAAQAPADRRAAPAADDAPAADRDDTLTTLFLCCHPSLTPASAIALTLRSVGGLTTAEIARAFLVPEATMAQRISRAKQRVKASGVPFRMPLPGERAGRLASVLHVLYLVFNEGYAGAGPDLQRVELAREAIRLTRMVHDLLPDEREVAGLLALMLLTDARRPARTAPDGSPVPLAEQDRSLWDGAAVAEGVALVTATLARGAVGPYQLQAAIAALHDEAATAEETDWPQILALYGLLERMSSGNPMVSLNRAVAAAMAHGAGTGLRMLAALEAGGRLAGHHRLHAARAHLLEMAGDRDAAVEEYRVAASRTTSIPERDHLTTRAARLAAVDPAAP